MKIINGSNIELTENWRILIYGKQEHTTDTTILTKERDKINAY